MEYIIANEEILEFARQLCQDQTNMRTDSIMGDKRYDLEIPDDTHWELVKLAADLKMHHEDYAQNVLIGHVEQELDRKASVDGDGGQSWRKLWHPHWMGWNRSWPCPMDIMGWGKTKTVYPWRINHCSC